MTFHPELGLSRSRAELHAGPCALLVATAVAATAGFYDGHALGDVIGDPGA